MLIKTIKKDETYFTFDQDHDDPERVDLLYKFPNDQVGVGSTKKESQDEYKKVEQGNAEIKDWAIWLQNHSTEEYISGGYEAYLKAKKARI